jgi:hypothetical protein
MGVQYRGSRIDICKGLPKVEECHKVARQQRCDGRGEGHTAVGDDGHASVRRQGGAEVRDRGGRRRGLAPMDSSLLASFSSSSVPPKPKPLASTPPAAVASPSPAMRPSCHRHLTLPGYAPVLPSIPIHARHCAAGPQPCPGGSGPGRRGGEEVASGADRGVFPGSDGAAGARGVWGASEGAQFLGHDLNKSQNVSFIWIIGWRLFLTFYIYSLF